MEIILKRTLIVIIFILFIVTSINAKNVNKKNINNSSENKCEVYDVLVPLFEQMDELYSLSTKIYNKQKCGNDTFPFWYSKDGSIVILNGVGYQLTNNIVDINGKKYKVVNELIGAFNGDYGDPDGWGSILIQQISKNTGKFVTYSDILYFKECVFE